MVLLARGVEVHNTEYDWDLTKWAPLVQEKELVQWLVKKPSEAEALRARPARRNPNRLTLEGPCWISVGHWGHCGSLTPWLLNDRAAPIEVSSDTSGLSSSVPFLLALFCALLPVLT